MKKLLVFMLAIVMLFSFTGCKRGTDLEEVTKDGKLIIGITDYEPLNYKVNGEWTGFEAELAGLFSKELGIEPEFVEIDWTEKYSLLEEYEIDCIWNGLTILPYLQTTVSMSYAYGLCNQILVMKADVVDNYKNGYDVRKLKFVAADERSGEAALERGSQKYSSIVPTQKDAIDAVKNGEADCAIVDHIFANQHIGKGEYSTLATSFCYSEEGIGVAFRKDSDLVEKFNEFLAKIRDEELIQLANKYGVTLY